MSSLNSHPWVELIGNGCAGGCHLHLIIDLTSCSLPLLASVKAVKPAMPWHLLFTGLPEDGIKEFGPLLVRIDPKNPLQRHWLDGLVETLATESRLLALGSSWPFEALATHLGRCLEIKMNGRLGLLRYYDPRTFPLLFSHVLTEEQQLPWLEPAVFWSWLDRDGKPVHMAGRPAGIQTFSEHSPVELCDRRLEMLSCARDAASAVKALTAVFAAKMTSEQRFSTCYAAMLEANKLGLLTASERYAYTRDQVSEL